MSYAFDQPTDISDADLAFPTGVGHMQPDYENIPDRYKEDQHVAVKFQRKWFFSGLSKDDTTGLEFRDGVDGKAAFRHLRYCMGSWEAKHEHKEAGVAFLLDKWIDFSEKPPRLISEGDQG